MTALKPASALAAAASRPCPGDGPERVAALRRALPVRRDGHVRHFWDSQFGGTQDPGQDPRGAPDPTPIWNILDLTPEGRRTDWYPKLHYPDAPPPARPRSRLSIPLLETR